MTEKDNIVTETENMENKAESAEAQQENAENTGVDAKIAELQKQLEESRNKYLYLFSDFENYKRNAAKERYDMMQTAGRDIMASLLSVLDDFDRALKNGALSDGTILIHQKLAHTLRSKGLNLIETKAGDAFNADLHEAVAEIPAASEELKGKIVDVLEQAYGMGDRTIRFAKVVVGK